ncbi:hypothetical protein AB838_18755 [Rhodobacteraceae bacterium (ex Bugula neritina AB1)]|nr:hypothetical protein AB838_18755 [Rhodobacteraceae bacterium (ex Bugula neritina AB1)]
MVAIERPLPRAEVGVPAAAYEAGNTRLSRVVVVYLIAMLMPFSMVLAGLFMTPLRFVLLVTSVPLLFQLLTGKYGRVIWTDILFLLHIAWMVVAMLANNPDRVVENIGSTGIEFLGGYLIARAAIRDRSDFIALCKFLGVAVVVLFPFALVETLTGRNVIIDLLRKVPLIRANNYGFAEPRLGLERVQTVLLHPIHYGMFCSIAFSLTIVGLRGSMGHSRRIVTSGIVGFSSFLSLSSGAFLSLMMQLFLLGWAWMLGNNKRKWYILIGLCVFLYVVIDLLSNRTPMHVFFTYATFSPHTAYWRSIILEWGMMNVWDNPWVGIGLNDWVRPWFMYSGSMDNFWLVIAVRFGIPGFLMLAFGYVYLIGRVMFRDFSADVQLAQMRRAWIFTFVGLTFTLSTVHVWTSIYSFVFFMLGAGAWMITAEPRGTEGEPEADSAPAQGNARRAARSFSRTPRNDQRTATSPKAPLSRPAPEAPAPTPASERASPYSRFAPKKRGSQSTDPS